MEIPFVDLKAQYAAIRNEVDGAMREIVENTAFIGGRALRDFEAEFATACGVEHCVGVGNGTDAIFIALKSLGIGAGDEVITAANSFIATSEAITMTGARVVFADVDSRTCTIDPAAVERAITPRTKAVVPVHLYGRVADMDAINAIAARHGLFVVEDAAQAHLARLGDRTVGMLGTAACFSFYPGKNLGAYGDGGAVVTSDPDLARRMRMFANHGRVSKYDHEFEGVNSRLDGLQAAVLRVKLRHLPEWNAARYAHACRYREHLQNVNGVELPDIPEEGSHVFHLFVVRVPERDRIRERLGERGIATGIHYPIALPNLTAYAYLEHEPGDFPVSSRYQDEILSLPMFPELTEAQIAYVAQCLAESL